MTCRCGLGAAAHIHTHALTTCAHVHAFAIHVHTCLQVVGHPRRGFTGIADLVCICVFAIWWIAMHGYYIVLARRRLKHPRIFDENLKDPKNMLCDNTVIPPLRASGRVTLLSRTITTNLCRASRALSGNGLVGRQSRLPRNQNKCEPGRASSSAGAAATLTLDV